MPKNTSVSLTDHFARFIDMQVAQGRYGEADSLFQRALAGRESVLGADHPDTLITLSEMAELYEAQGRYSEAEAFYTRALDAQTFTLGDAHRDTLTTLHGPRQPDSRQR